MLVLLAHALAWSAAFAFWAFVPTGSGILIGDVGPDGRCSMRDGVIDPGPDGVCEVTEYSSTFLEDQDPGAIWVLLFPVLLTVPALATVLFIHKRRAIRSAMLWGPAIVLLGLCVLAGFSIGLYYMPAALALIVAAGVDLSQQGNRSEARVVRRP